MFWIRIDLPFLYEKKLTTTAKCAILISLERLQKHVYGVNRHDLAKLFIKLISHVFSLYLFLNFFNLTTKWVVFCVWIFSWPFSLSLSLHFKLFPDQTEFSWFRFEGWKHLRNFISDEDEKLFRNFEFSRSSNISAFQFFAACVVGQLQDHDNFHRIQLLGFRPYLTYTQGRRAVEQAL